MPKDDTKLTAEEKDILSMQKGESTSKGDEREVLDEADEEAAIAKEAEAELKKQADKRSRKAEKAKAKAKEEDEPEADDSDADDEPAPKKAKAEEDKAKPKTEVPMQAVDRERNKRKEAESQLAQVQRELAELRGMMQRPPQMQQPAQQAQQPDDTEPPDPVVDFEGFKAWHRRNRERQEQVQQSARKQYEEQQQRVQAVDTLMKYAREHENSFRAEHADKDYDGALEFARERKRQELSLWGFSDEQIPGMMAQIEAGVTAMAMQRGLSPAAYIYNYARMNGYEPGGQRREAQHEPDEQRVTRLADVQRRTASAATASGAPRGDELEFMDLAAMSPKQLAKLQKEKPDELRRILGG